MTVNKQHFTKQLGKAIAQYRQKQGLTQEQIAEKLGITNEAVSKFERGVSTPSLTRLFEYSEIFNCKIVDLFSVSSDRVIDRADYLTQLLLKVNEEERALIIDMVEKMVEHFSKNP